MRVMSAITRTGGSTPSDVVRRCSPSIASSFPRTNRSTPHNRIVDMPESESSSVDSGYERGLALARGGELFAAHEAFEEAWRACEEHERDFFQGLVHVVVSTYQRDRGKPVAAERQRVKAITRLAAYAPAHRGLDVAALLAKLEAAEADPREHLVEPDAEPPVAVEEEQQAEDDERRA